MKDIIEVPQECSSLVGWYAISEQGMRAILAEDMRKEAAAETRYLREKQRAELAEERENQQKQIAQSADWWSRWGLTLGLSGGTVAGVVVGAIVGIFAARGR
jgi:hypothetical protein